MKTAPLIEARSLEKRGGFARIGYSKSRFEHRGFALVTTLILMILITLIAVGMLSLSAITLRSSNQGADQAQARANARLALMIALGNLQKYTGPDQRVTASADITFPAGTPSGSNLKWTGVWTTTRPTDASQALSATNPPDPTKPVVTGAADPSLDQADQNYLSDYRNKPGFTQKSLMLAWLVSGEPAATANPSVSTPTNPHVTLVEKAAGLDSAAAADPLRDRVTAPLVMINAGGNQSGGYAYWIGDESLKARTNLKLTDKQPNMADPQDGGMARLAGGQGPNLRYVKSAATSPYGPVEDASAADRAKLITTDSIGLLLPAGTSTVYRKNFHDFTAYSENVLADVREGGLKKDLTSYVNQAGNVAPPAIPGIPETGLADDFTDPNLPGHAMLPGPLYAKFGPNFLQLRKWYQLSKNVTGGFDSGKMDPVFLKNRSSVSLWGISWGNMPDLKCREQSVQPVLAEARITFDFSVDTSRAGGMAVRTHVYPKVKLWNPYNVTLKAHSYLIGFPKFVYLHVQGYGVTRISNPAWNGGNGSDWQTFFTNDNQTSPLGDLYFVLEAVDLEPGECLFFSPKTSGESQKYDTSNIAANVLSPSVPAGGLENFYFDSDCKLTATASPPPTSIVYGMSNFAVRNYLFKDAGASPTSITNAEAQGSSNPAKYPIIQRLVMDHAGDNGSMSPNWGSPYPNPGGWGSASTGMRTSAGHDGAVPMSSWYMGARLRAIDENPNEQSGGYSTSPGRFPLNNPQLSAFNIRSQVMHRCNFDTQYDWVWWTVGPYINSRADSIINDPSMQGQLVNGRYLASPFGKKSDYSSAKKYAMFEVPRKELPPFSLASFQHAQLGYQSWQPTYIVGHSFANGRSARIASVHTKTNPTTAPLLYYDHQKAADEWDGNFRARENSGNWRDIVQYTAPEARELLIYDSCYAVNHALWDRYFLSTIPFNDSGNPALPPEPVRLANPRMMMSPYTRTTAQETRTLLSGNKDFDYAAYFLMHQGGFNVNSTSVEAWRAFFTSVNDVQRPLRDGTTMAKAFSRLLLPGTSTQADSHVGAGAWDGARILSEADINLMAVAMVKNVKVRGPFLGVADFVNRRLTPVLWNNASSGQFVANSMIADPTMCGPLQAAIEEASVAPLQLVNGKLQQTTGAYIDSTIPNVDSGGWWSGDPNHRNFWPDGYAFGPWETQAAPGYLTQADILQSAGANITARGDTFVIRAYGDKRDPSGKVIARAWCEAIVQRTPDYVAAKPIDVASDSTGNNPMEPTVIRSTTKYAFTLNPNIIGLNKTFGRRYVIKGFRWLNSSEV